jgi:hypothetical protein
MNRTSKLAIAVLSVLCIGLAVNTVVQATSRARPEEQPTPMEAAIVPDIAMQSGATPLEDVAFEEIGAPPDAAPLGFVGEWVNLDEGLGPLSRITIDKDDEGLAIRPWSASIAGENTYGGAREFDGQSNPVEITWDAGFAQQRMRLAVMPDGLLRVDRVAECLNHQCGTPHQPTTEYFTKATPADLAAHEEAVKGAVAQAELERATGMPGAG